MKKLNIYCLFLSLIILLAGCSKNEGGPDEGPGNDNDNIEQIDKMIQNFMSKNALVGMSLAVARDGKLVYARGYGFADRETGEKISLPTKFRISSISKSITAATIMKLVEEGKLSVDDKIFGDDGILENDFGTRPYKQYITDLTVKHCLSHRVGGWSNTSNDPTMANNQMDANQLISWIIDNRPLNVAPGTSYAYSNVGYMILGRVIEKITGKSYAQYVQEKILAPSGINKMEIGGNTFADKKENESRYHGKGSENPYGYNFSRRDANGGWIASASDLVKLMVHIDGFPSVPDVLQPATLQTMTTPAYPGQTYAYGFTVQGSKWSHSGSFPGSASHWLRTGSGFCAVIFSNTSVDNLSGLLDDIVAAPVSWPDQDLFQ